MIYERYKKKNEMVCILRVVRVPFGLVEWNVGVSLFLSHSLHI